eukprot:3030728-Rhodomonas_salina.1
MSSQPLRRPLKSPGRRKHGAFLWGDPRCEPKTLLVHGVSPPPSHLDKKPPGQYSLYQESGCFSRISQRFAGSRRTGGRAGVPLVF